MDAHEQVMASMRRMAETYAHSGLALRMPPASNATLGTQYTAIDYGTMLEARINYDERFSNPLHMFQGGFLCAALDEVYGPLTYMAAERPVVTIEMSTSFLRPFTAKDEAVIIRATVVAQTKSLMVLKAEVKTLAGKLVATSTTHSLITSESTLQKATATR